MSRPEEVLLRVYGSNSLSGIAKEAYGISGSDFNEQLEKLWSEKKARREIIDEFDEDVRGFLAFMDKIGRRLRGERLKKRWFLHGYADFDSRVMPLVEKGIVVVGNINAREPVALEQALDQGITQQWLQVTPGFEGLSGKPPEKRKVVESVEDETTAFMSRRLIVVEFNLLQIARFVETNGIRLNRDASPHRSDLKALGPFLIDRFGSEDPEDVTPDPLQTAGWDVHIFLISLAEALGIIVRDEEELVAESDGLGYFTKPVDSRLNLLHRGMEQQRSWSELEAVQWYADSEPPQTGNGHGAFLLPDQQTGALAGPRGSVLSALRRLHPKDWFDVDDTTRTIASLESQYLSTALPVGVSGEPLIEDFVRAVLTRTLVHVAAIELGTSSKDEPRARLTEVGRVMLGIDETLEEPSGEGSILVEPNFEITCFLDGASPNLLYHLSRFSELIDTSERVAKYKLTGESVQWGYARGYEAKEIEKILDGFTTQPIPPAVTFALEDWERIHRRVIVYLNGSLVASTGRSDPEIVQSGVTFAIKENEHIEIIDDTFTFVVDGYEEELDRALRAHRPREIDYEGTIVPSLQWVDDERVKAPLGATDLRIVAELEPYTEQEDVETFRVDKKKVEKVHPNGGGYDALITLLRKSVAGGLAAEKEILLKSVLGVPADSSVESMEVLMVSSAEDGERIARVTALKPFVESRLGPRAFHVKPGKLQDVIDVLANLGISVEDLTDG